MFLIYKYRAYPDEITQRFCRRGMELCRHLYNDAIQERRGAYAIGQHVTRKMQLHQLKHYKKLDKEYLALPYEWPEEIINRLDCAYQLFFKNFKKGYRPPQFKKRLDTVKYIRSHTFRVESNKFIGSKLPAAIPFVLDRPLPAKPTSCFIRENNGRWFIGFTVNVPEAETSVANLVGIDAGISHLLADSNGDFYDLQRRHGLESKLKRYQRKLARQTKGSKRMQATKRLITELHGRIARFKEHAIHNMTSKISTSHVVSEALNLEKLGRGFLSAQFNANPIGKAFKQIEYKTKLNGRLHDKVTASGTSQLCICGAYVPKKLHHRIHHCSVCGVTVPRDTMSAMVIRARSKLVSGQFTVQQTPKTANC